MASEKEMYEIIGRAVADKQFREALILNPQNAVKALGYSLTPEQSDSLKESKLGMISEELNTRISKMGLGCGAGGLGLSISMGPS